MPGKIIQKKLEYVEQLDQITCDAAGFFDVPYAMINLVTEDRVIFMSCTGLIVGDSLDRHGSFCSAASAQEKPLMITDAAEHPDFKSNPIVTGSLGIRSYAGKSLHAPDGTRLGTLCVLDTKPREYTVEQLNYLAERANEASSNLHAILTSESLHSSKPSETQAE